MLPSGMNTYVGLLVAIAPVVLSLFGIAPTPSFNEQLPNTIAEVVQIIGLLYAFYGRATAQVPGWFAKK
jgi:hypothetical protein